MLATTDTNNITEGPDHDIDKLTAGQLWSSYYPVRQTWVDVALGSSG